MKRKAAYIILCLLAPFALTGSLLLSYFSQGNLASVLADLPVTVGNLRAPELYFQNIFYKKGSRVLCLRIRTSSFCNLIASVSRINQC